MIKTTTFSLILLISGMSLAPSDIYKLDDQPKELELFAEDLISTGLYERDMAISNDGDEIIYSIGDYEQSFRALVQIKKSNDKWGDPGIMSFSGKYNDIEPFFTPDGKRLYFASDRPFHHETESSDYNIWYSEKENGKWGEPQPLDTMINTEGDEFYPSISKNGNLYFTATREDGIGREDIFISEFSNGKYKSPEPLDTAINTGYYEFNAYINPDEDLLIFSSYGRADGLGGGDLYFSKKDENGNWSPAQNMGEKINSSKLDYCPFIDLPRGNFYFTSDRMEPLQEKINSVEEFKSFANRNKNGMGNIYRISIEEAGF